MIYCSKSLKPTVLSGPQVDISTCQSYSSRSLAFQNLNTRSIFDIINLCYGLIIIAFPRP